VDIEIAPSDLNKQRINSVVSIKDAPKNITQFCLWDRESSALDRDFSVSYATTQLIATKY
jgi:hypothetical protein